MTIRKAERILSLANALAERRVMHLRQAAELLGVSEMTVRRDIAGRPDQFALASFSGAHNLDMLTNFGINLAFLSAAGVDAERGATCAHFHEAHIKQKVISLARENYLVVDSSKIGKLQRAFFAPVSAFD